MNQDTRPLVSIVVITYNSSKYVIETLESAKNQTYTGPLELIISDDCSTDNTVELCQKWLDQNRNRFVRTNLITVNRNTGIAPNCNRGHKDAQGEWIKGIAGDDILMDNCIKDNIKFITQTPDAKIVFSDMQRVNLLSKPTKRLRRSDFFSLKTVEEQQRYLIKRYCGNTPTMFVNNRTIKEMGYFNEEYPFIEDYPLIFNISRTGCFLYFFNTATVKYRCGDGVTTNNMTIAFMPFIISQWAFFRKELFANRKSIEIFITYHDVLTYFILYNGYYIFKNKRSFIFRCFARLLYFTDCYFWKVYLTDQYLKAAKIIKRH